MKLIDKIDEALNNKILSEKETNSIIEGILSDDIGIQECVGNFDEKGIIVPLYNLTLGSRMFGLVFGCKSARNGDWINTSPVECIERIDDNISLIHTENSRYLVIT